MFRCPRSVLEPEPVGKGRSRFRERLGCNAALPQVKEIVLDGSMTHGRVMVARLSLSTILLCTALAAPAEGASVSKTYSYFSVGGATVGELQEELTSRGPKLKSSGQRHPGAVEMQFTSSLDYADANGRCRISRATVTVRAKIILPRWKRPASAGLDTRLVWGALSGDIKRHEESHVSIARGYARDMEQALLALPPQTTCAKAAERGQETIRRLLAAHDAAQARFDRIEMINFSARLDRLIRYRIEQNEAGRVRD